uniref:Ovule protein n=1 Tax=Meloidogyne incognita TaxID=6306 RepID=A0A914KUH4_MELIC
MFMLWKNCGWEMELHHHGKSPDRSTNDCAIIQPDVGLFIFILCTFCKCGHNRLPYKHELKRSSSQSCVFFLRTLCH